MTLTPRRVLTAFTAIMLLAGAALPARAQDKVVNVYNWNDYIDEAVIARFEKETGIKVRYDVFDSLETLEGKLLAGKSGYDVIVPTNEPTLSRFVKSGALQPLPKAKIPNLANLDPKLMAQLASSDPGNHYAAIYLWGTIGIAYVPEKLKTLAPGAPVDSWSLLFDPAWAGKMKSCGVTMMDSQIDVFPSALKAAGKSPVSTSAADAQAAEKLLMGIRPTIRTFSTGGVINALAAGETCLAFAYSGDAIQAAVRAKEANRGTSVAYVLPKEGAQVWFDTMAMPKDAPNPDNAAAFINFILQPDVIAAISNSVRYANGVPASRPMLLPEIANDSSIYPTEAVAARLFTNIAVPQAAERERNRLWARFKAGH